MHRKEEIVLKHKSQGKPQLAAFFFLDAIIISIN